MHFSLGIKPSWSVEVWSCAVYYQTWVSCFLPFTATQVNWMVVVEVFRVVAVVVIFELWFFIWHVCGRWLASFPSYCKPSCFVLPENAVHGGLATMGFSFGWEIPLANFAWCVHCRAICALLARRGWDTATGCIFVPFSTIQRAAFLFRFPPFDQTMVLLYLTFFFYMWTARFSKKWVCYWLRFVTVATALVSPDPGAAVCPGAGTSLEKISDGI